MKTNPIFDDTLHDMKSATRTGKNAWEELYGEGYFGRVHRTAWIVFALVAIMLGARAGLPALVGFAYGGVVSLGSLKVVELMVRWFLRPDLPWNRARVGLLMVLKLPFLTLIVALAAWMSVNGIANVFALVGGLALAPTVIFLKTASVGLLSVLPEAPGAGWIAEMAERASQPRPAPRSRRPQPGPGARVAGDRFTKTPPHYNEGFGAAD
jgi:hypothetical protein